MSEKTEIATYVLVADLFFRSKIRAVATAAGVAPHFARNFAELQALLSAVVDPVQIIIDLNDRSIRALEFIPGLAQAGHHLLGFVSHVDVAMTNAARESGCAVMPRAQFVEKLPAILQGVFPEKSYL